MLLLWRHSPQPHTVRQPRSPTASAGSAWAAPRRARRTSSAASTTRTSECVGWRCACCRAGSHAAAAASGEGCMLGRQLPLPMQHAGRARCGGCCATPPDRCAAALRPCACHDGVDAGQSRLPAKQNSKEGTTVKLWSAASGEPGRHAPCATDLLLWRLFCLLCAPHPYGTHVRCINTLTNAASSSTPQFTQQAGARWLWARRIMLFLLLLLLRLIKDVLQGSRHRPIGNLAI
jgi:hypothetical protein